MAKHKKIEFCSCSKEIEIAEIHTIVMRLDKQLTGNGQIGLINEIQQAKGAMAVWKWIAGSGLLTSIVAIAHSIISG